MLKITGKSEGSKLPLNPVSAGTVAIGGGDKVVSLNVRGTELWNRAMVMSGGNEMLATAMVAAWLATELRRYCCDDITLVGSKP